MAHGFTRRDARKFLRHARPLADACEIVLRSGDGGELVLNIPQRRAHRVLKGSGVWSLKHAPAPDDRRHQGQYVSDFASK
jgi:hypothetical protein